jgi:hypothetical protein
MFMKGVILGGLLLLSLACLGNSGDTTVTSFEIHLKRKADNPLGFNTCNIDRQFIYNLVLEKLQKKIRMENTRSIHRPYVLMKFVDVCGRGGRQKEITEADRQMLNQFDYTYFIKICGSLDIDRTLDRHAAATFKLRVYVFDADGNMVAKSKSRSHDNNLVEIDSTTAENYPLNENEFLNLVTKAADSLEISI